MEKVETATRLHAKDSPEQKPQRSYAELVRDATKRMEGLFTPDYLKMISGASDGFSFGVDPSLIPEELRAAIVAGLPREQIEKVAQRTGLGKVGYTRMDTKRINTNPLFLDMEDQPLRGFLCHEVGHHAPEVVAFQDKVGEHNLHDLTIPPAFNQTRSLREKFLVALHSHLNNSLFDVWLERFMGRQPFGVIRDDITHLHTGGREGGWKRSSMKNLAKPEQLSQLLVGEATYPSGTPVSDIVDTDVAASYKRIVESRAMNSLQATQVFQSAFSTPYEREMAIQRKFNAYTQVFLPEYLRLLEKEAQKRIDEKKKQQGGDEGEEGADGEDGEDAGGKGKKGGKKGQGKGKAGPDAAGGDMAAHRDVLEDLLNELTEAGKKYEALAPSEEDVKKEQAIRRAIREIAKGTEEGKGGAKPSPSEGPRGLDAISDQMGQAEADRRESQLRGLAESLGVKQEYVRRWSEIKEEYRNEIESTATALADVFLENRRRRIEYLKREGDIVPGLEAETVSAVLSGELDPDTRMNTVRDPEFLETEIEWLLDQSGSMSGKKLELSIALIVIIIEAMKRVRELIESENLLLDDEEPLRVGLTGYDVRPYRITKLDEPLTDAKEIKIVEEGSTIRGGTQETSTITSVYGEMRLRRRNVLKIIGLITDGHGDGEAVHPIMEQIEKDDEVVFLAIGLGETDEEANAVVASYLEPIKNRQGNVFAIAKSDVEEVLPAVIDFLKREVEKRRGMFT